MGYKSRFCWTTPYQPGQYEEIFKHPSPGKAAELERRQQANKEAEGKREEKPQ